jgi:hypothetical protein
MVELNEGLGYFPHFCEECRHKIDEVEWFEHHRRNPTPEALDIKYREGLTVVFSRNA